MVNNATNISSDDFGEDPFTEHHPTFLVFYIIIMICGLVGNVIVVLTVLLNPTMRSLTYSLMIALAFSDFIFLLMSPFHVYGAILYPGLWPLKATGDIGCKMYYYLFRALYALSVIILMIITVERFLAVRFPLKFREQKLKASVVIPVAIIAALAFVSPELHGIKLDESFCGASGWVSDLTHYKNYYIVVYLFLFIIPLFLMLVLYTMIWMTLRQTPPSMADKGNRRISRRRRMANMLFLVVFGFFVCWTPWNILESITVFSLPDYQSDVFYTCMSFSMLLVFTSAAINPIVYGFMSEEMRNNAISIFCRRGHVRIVPEGQTVCSQ